VKRTDRILAQCIDDIRSGKASLADCLDRYPGIRTELESFLKIALSIKEPSGIKPSDAFKIRARANLMEHIHASQAPKRSPRPVSQAGAKQVWYAGWLKPIAVAIAAIIFVSAMGTGTAYASQDSLPGDTLYLAKLGTEQLQRVLTFNNAAEVELELRFADTRLGEMGAIANERPDRMTIAVTGYERNLKLAISIAEQSRNGELLLETVALAISDHLSRLDEIEDSVTETARESVSSAEATEINIEAMEGRLNRARAESERGNGRGVEKALQQFERLRRFGEEIAESARGMGHDTTAIDELNARATAGHMETLGFIYGKVTQENKGTVEQAMGVSAEEHEKAVKGLQQQGALGDIPEEAPVPENIPDDVKKRILQPESKGSGNSRK